MLFRRLAEHVGAQNWTAVVLDFAIVLVGVLLAFQINTWNRDRIEQSEQTAALHRLLTESEETITYFRETITRFQEGNASRAELLTRLQQDQWENFDNDRMARAIVTIGRAPPASPPRSAYDAVIASGLFSELGDAATRDAVTGYYAAVDYLNGMSEYIQRISIGEPYWISDSVVDVYSPDDVYQTRTVVNVERLRAAAEFTEMLVRGHRAQMALTDWWQRALV